MKDVLILGAGFGGLELATLLSERHAGDVRVTLIDQSEGFTFGFEKFDILFGKRTADEVRLPYTRICKPGVEFRREEVLSIDPRTRRVRTNAATYDPEALVVALGADYVPFDGYEFYSVRGAEQVREVLPSIERGKVVVGVLGLPYKCPPAPYEAVLLLHDYFVDRGVRYGIELGVASPAPSPIPVSPETSAALVSAMEERGIVCTFGSAPDPSEADYFFAVPLHEAPQVVRASGLTQGGTDGWIKVDPRSLRTPFEGVWALGDVADAPVPRAGVFAESAARVVADDLAGILGIPFEGRGRCYVEFGGGRVGIVDADFLSGPAPTAPLIGPSFDLANEKERFARDRRRRWFGL